MIADIIYQQGAAVDEIFRIHKPVCRVARNMSRYMACSLKDSTGMIQAYAWLDRSHGVSLEEKALVRVTGTMRWFADRWHVDISSTTCVDSHAVDPLLYLPDDYCPIAEGLMQLNGIVDQLKIQPLREFMLNVLRDDRITLPFLELPASRNHHHAHAGGLLQHSLECARFITQAAGMWNNQHQRELAICAALLHDIGKTRTLNKTHGAWMGTLLSHDLLTLELLAPHLVELDHSWQDGSVALRYLLSWKLQERGRRPLMTVVELLQAADRISSGLYNESELFSGAPEWKQFVTDGASRKFWRPAQMAVNYG